jgi:hypothetical protein
MTNHLPISSFIGKIFTKIVGMHKNSGEIVFSTKNETFCMAGAEGYPTRNDVDVYIEDVCGDVEDLIDTKIVAAIEAKSENNQPTYTFYTLRTIKGTVTLRWYGTSNGYYAEEAEICQTRHKQRS